MLWRIFQIAIFTAVLMSNVAWRWTPNGYVASGVAFLVALLFTVGMMHAIDVVRIGGRLRWSLAAVFVAIFVLIVATSKDDWATTIIFALLSDALFAGAVIAWFWSAKKLTALSSFLRRPDER